MISINYLRLSKPAHKRKTERKEKRYFVLCWILLFSPSFTMVLPVAIRNLFSLSVFFLLTAAAGVHCYYYYTIILLACYYFSLLDTTGYCARKYTWRFHLICDFLIRNYFEASHFKFIITLFTSFEKALNKNSNFRLVCSYYFFYGSNFGFWHMAKLKMKTEQFHFKEINEKRKCFKRFS